MSATRTVRRAIFSGLYREEREVSKCVVTISCFYILQFVFVFLEYLYKKRWWKLKGRWIFSAFRIFHSTSALCFLLAVCGIWYDIDKRVRFSSYTWLWVIGYNSIFHPSLGVFFFFYVLRTLFVFPNLVKIFLFFFIKIPA